MYNKYGNKKTIIDGIKFDSKAEGKRYQELKLMARAGLITDIELQPRFLIQDKFKYDGKTERKIEYVADFRYKEGDKIIIEDVKGMKTDVYKLKRKMFLFRYPELTFREI